MKTLAALAAVSIAFVFACSSKSDGGVPQVGELPATPTMPAGESGGVDTPPAAPAPAAAPPSDAGARADAANDASTTTKSFECCVDAECFVCPTQAALQKCQGFDLQACFAACAKNDAQCFGDCADKIGDVVPDPSDCQAKP